MTDSGVVNMNNIEQTIKKKLEELSRKIMAYISRRGYLISSGEIAKSLCEMSASDLAPRVLVQDIAFGTRFFKNLRRYIPTHIDYVRRSVDLLYTRSPLPSVFAKIVYQIYIQEKLKVHGLARVLGITRFYIRRGLKDILSLERKMLAIRSVGEAYRREVAKVAKMHKRIRETMQKLSIKDIFCIVAGPLEREYVEEVGVFRGSHSLFFESPRGVTFKILAVLKYVDEKPEVLLQGRSDE